MTAWEVIEGRANVAGRAVVADWRCDWVGPGVAEMLAAQGCSVRLCVNGETMGQSLQSYVRHMLAGRLHALGVEVIPYTRLFGADADTVYLQHIVTGEAVLCEDVGTLVLAYGHQGDFAALRGPGRPRGRATGHRRLSQPAHRRRGGAGGAQGWRKRSKRGSVHAVHAHQLLQAEARDQGGTSRKRRRISWRRTTRRTPGSCTFSTVSTTRAGRRSASRFGATRRSSRPAAGAGPTS